MLTRRQMLLSALGVAGVGVAASMLPLRSLSAGAQTRYLLVGEQLSQNAFAVAVMTLPHLEKRLINIPFKPHSFVQDPQNPHMVWTFEKWGPFAAIVDIHSAKLVRLIAAVNDMWFFGHGTVLPGTDVVYASQVHQKTYAGHLTGYHMQHATIEAMPKVCDGGVHEMKGLADGTIVIACAGNIGGASMPGNKPKRVADSAIVHYDLKLEKELGRAITSDAEQLINHLQLLSEKRVLGLASNIFNRERRERRAQARATNQEVSDLPGTDEHGNLYVANLGDYSMQRVHVPDAVDERLSDELLSSAISADGAYVVVTNPFGVQMLVLKHEDLSLIEAVNLPVGSVVLDATEQRFYAGAEQGLFAFEDDARTAKGTPRVVKAAAGTFSGSHSAIITV